MLAGEEVKDGNGSKLISPPKLKQSGAFRHTEYAKGFYKVNNANANANTIVPGTTTQAAYTVGEMSRSSIAGE